MRDDGFVLTTVLLVQVSGWILFPGVLNHVFPILLGRFYYATVRRVYLHRSTHRYDARPQDIRHHFEKQGSRRVLRSPLVGETIPVARFIIRQHSIDNHFFRNPRGRFQPV